MKILQDFNLSKLNTFGINASAKFFVEIEAETDLTELFFSSEFKQNEKLFLGGGSNILFTKDFEGIVVANRLKGIEVLEENSENVFVRSMGGELWSDFVTFTVNHEYWGAENLSLIPGTVGAAPVQNIGAYGVELEDILEKVEAYNVKTGEKKVFLKDECELGYRDSIFKKKLKNQYFITAVVFKLNKKLKKNIIYKALEEYLKENNIKISGPADISNAIIAIRKSKLPDPKFLGSAGSFFKNVYVNKKELNRLRNSYPEIPVFEENNLIKIPAGWLIEQCGWKGKSVGNTGVYDKQALVLINYGGATGEEVFDLANKIIYSVKEKFGLDLVPEVNIV